MGANVSLLAPHAHTVALRSYVDVLANYTFLDVVNNTRFLKSVRAYDRKARTLVVIKVFVKPPQTPVDLHVTVEAILQELAVLAPYPCFLPSCAIIELDSAGYLVRPMARTSLYDRLSLRPFLTPGEKAWVVYQMLRAVETLHGLGGVHGDLKTENVLVTSSNWILLADFSRHTKPLFLPDDNPAEFSFYFDSSGRRSCYIAPERFVPKKEALKLTHGAAKAHLAAADLFALGCVVAELYMDGEPPFTLLDLFVYKKSGTMPLFSGISDKAVRGLVAQCLALDPGSRPSAETLLKKYKDDLFPGYFDRLYDLVSEANTASAFSPNENTSIEDLRIQQLYKEFGAVAETLGFVDTTDSDPAPSLPPYTPSSDLLQLNVKGYPPKYIIRGGRSHQSTETGALVLLDAVVSQLGSVKRPVLNTQACELILLLSERVSDDAKLDRALPYLVNFVEEFVAGKGDSRVAAKALLSINTLLVTVDNISAINSCLFPEYLLPKLKALAFLGNPDSPGKDLLKSTLAMCLPNLAQLSQKFGGSAADHDIKDITEALLTDPSVSVRTCLVERILPLCQYFGMDRTNDIILPHLITYLNDPSYQLRLAFLQSILDIGSFIGVLAFEQYLLPLLLQTLGDHEPFVVLKVLEIFVFFVNYKLINPAAEFNALAIYKELVVGSLPLLVQPNEWIRHSVIYLILGISDNLLDADRFCFLYPLIKTYLSYDISQLTWPTLYPSLVRPLNRKMFDLVLVWLLKSTSRSLFWKQGSVPVYAHGRRKQVTFSKDMGKSVYLGVSDPARTESQLSQEDRTWLAKLIALGMEENELWKVFVLKSYLIGVSRSSGSAESGDQTQFDLASNVSIPPKNFFFEVLFKSEHIEGPGTTFTSNGDGDTNGLLAMVSKAKASLGTNEANVFGELNSTWQLPRRSSSSRESSSYKDENHRVYSVSDEQIITATMRHNFSGNNPFILRYLQGLDFLPLLDDFPEFGHVVRQVQDSVQQQDFSLLGAPVARISAGSEDITAIAVAPSSEFFITGTESGALRLWDTAKMESPTKKPTLGAEVGSLVTKIVFFAHRLLVAVSCVDGTLRVFRVNVVRGKHRRIIKYSSMTVVRETRLESGYVRDLKLDETKCYCVTSTGRIVVYDVITMKPDYEMRHEPKFGVISSLVVGTGFLILLTLDGVLSLWDTRFRKLVSSYQLIQNEKNAGIIELSLLQSEKPRIAILSDCISIWDVPEFTCTKVFSAGPAPSIRLERSRSDFTSPIDLSTLNFSVGGAMALVSDTHIVQSGTQVVSWDIKKPANLVAVSGGQVSHRRDGRLQVSKARKGTLDLGLVGVLWRPYCMVVCADRNGGFEVYK